MPENKIILLTGASAGIGAETAELLASLGAIMILADKDERLGRSISDAISEKYEESVFVTTDVSNAKSVASLFALIEERFGRLDCAINNAGVTHGLMKLGELSEADYELVMDVNLKGTWLCMKHELALMQRGGGGHIVNMASVAGLRSAPLLGLYAASKYGVVGLTKTAASEYAKDNIRVNAVCPSPIRTPMFEKIQQEAPEIAHHVATSNPMRRLGEPHEIAEVLAWLCSDASRFMTGVALPVDGGFCA